MSTGQGTLTLPADLAGQYRVTIDRDGGVLVEPDEPAGPRAVLESLSSEWTLTAWDGPQDGRFARDGHFACGTRAEMEQALVAWLRSQAPAEVARYLAKLREHQRVIEVAKAELIEACRNRPKGVTREDVAAELGISLRGLAYWLAGRR